MSTDSQATQSGQERNWSTSLAEDSYLRNRLSPSIGNIDYLPFLDLLTVVRHFAKAARGSLFDYGCGGTPYRRFFTHCDKYVAADIVSGPQVDVVLPENGLTSEPSCSYHTVFSSQVLEHVPEPGAYFAEAFRILKPGGVLILTTHGMFLEHGCPDDFYRWTGYGLEKAARDAGFEALETVKISPGARASAHLVHTAVANWRAPRSTLLHLSTAVFRRLYAAAFQWLINRVAVIFEPRAFVPATDPAAVYIGVGILARRPVSDSCD